MSCHDYKGEVLPKLASFCWFFSSFVHNTSWERTGNDKGLVWKDASWTQIGYRSTTHCWSVYTNC